MVLQAIKYSRGHLEILDQLRLPHEEIYIQIKHSKDAWHAIKRMQVRGAPAIAIVAALSLAVEAGDVIKTLDQGVNFHNQGSRIPSPGETAKQIGLQLEYLVTSRPTAVNLADAAAKLKIIVGTAADDPGSHCRSVLDTYVDAAEKMLVDDVNDNERIGRHGAAWIHKNSSRSPAEAKVSVITHCNTGSLATAGYGTALGVIRSLHSAGSLHHAFYTETRPYNQGSRLTGYELIHDGIPATLITDSMAGALLQSRRKTENIAAVIVGADRVAANGDTANKIGTYALAVLARYHGVKFLVAAPQTTIDTATETGADITIEERPQIEVLNIKGPRISKNKSGEQEIVKGSVEEVSIAAEHTHAWNPAFDVTPAELVDGIVTEEGVVEKDEHGVFQWSKVFGVEIGEREVPRVEEPKTMNMLPDGTTALEA